MSLKVFVDTDVAISSLISEQGAAFLLLNQTKHIDLCASNISSKEILKVATRLRLDAEKAKHLIDTRFSKVRLQASSKDIKISLAAYVQDPNDAHIVAGAKAAQASFLVTYNTKDFKSEKLKEDFDIILATPAQLLQYLRSRA